MLDKILEFLKSLPYQQFAVAVVSFLIAFIVYMIVTGCTFSADKLHMQLSDNTTDAFTEVLR